MEWWIDAQLPPSLAITLRRLSIPPARHLFEIGMVSAKDEAIFFAARGAGASIVTKDRDFLRLLERHGAPPRVLWITTGNIRNHELEAILVRGWPTIESLFASGEALVELGDRR